MEKNNKTKGCGLSSSLGFFGSASILLLFETHIIIPFLSSRTGYEPVIFWFTIAGLGMFLPMLIAAYFVLKNEKLAINKNTWIDRLRFRKMSGEDWLWSIGAIIVIVVMSFIIMKLLEMYVENFKPHPSFMSFDVLTPDRYWILLLWFPYWLLNIMGEEILWRGVILPRQELVFGNMTWIVHGFFWGIFHLAFGWQLLLTLLPILFVQSYVVQRRKNSWTGVVIHAGINGPSFLMISFGMV